MTLTSHHNALPPGTVLMEYRLTGLLGAGAFGITYLARDAHLDKDVAIKEYLPGACAARGADGNVVPIAQQQAQDYRWGLERFSLEARTLARFSHPHIVRVIRYFEANGTGYMVMDYERGESLKYCAQSRAPLAESEIERIVAPLLDGLERVHAAGFLHRDIKPDNIFLREDGGPVLLDFGSARRTGGASEQALTTIVTPGYAPFEQYTTSKPQGPWSDIYSLGGVLYFLVTGHSPPDAITRMKGDTLGERLAGAARRYSAGLIEAIGWAMALEEKDRPRDIAGWREALLRPSTTPIDLAAPLPDAQTLRVEPHVPTGMLRADAGSAPTLILRTPEPTLLHVDAASVDTRAPSYPSPQDVARGAGWAGYASLMAVSAVLGTTIAMLPAFQESALMNGRLGAAALAQWLGMTGAVVFAWLLGRDLARRMSARTVAHAALYAVLMPVVSALALGAAYAVAHRLLAPALDDAQLAAAAWAFLLATCACAIWLSMAVFSHADALRHLLHEYRLTSRRDASALAGSKEN
jgi:serine/threonine protein kinase